MERAVSCKGNWYRRNCESVSEIFREDSRVAVSNFVRSLRE
jgi:hypothetical protein